MTAYRVRLDTTTNWAISSSALLSTFALGNTGISHAAFLFLMLLNLFFLQLEARRFRAYEASRYRVLLLERYFYPEVLGDRVNPEWPDHLIATLAGPQVTVNRIGALGWRLRRNYLWIYGVVLVTWIVKLEIQGGDFGQFGDFIARASVGSVAGSLVFGTVGAFYVTLILLTVLSTRIYPMGDDEAVYLMEVQEDT